MKSLFIAKESKHDLLPFCIPAVEYLICSNPLYRGSEFFEDDNLCHISSILSQCWILFWPTTVMAGMLKFISILKSKFEKDVHEIKILKFISPFLAFKPAIDLASDMNPDCKVLDQFFEIFSNIICILSVNMKNFSNDAVSIPRGKEQELSLYGFKTLKMFILAIDFLKVKSTVYKEKLSKAMKPLIDDIFIAFDNTVSMFLKLS